MAAWIVIGSLLVVLSLFSPKAGSLFLVAYGVFSVSGLFGFMLGIRPGDNPTHLQVIAEWLTKLIIGAGLVQFKSLGNSVLNFAEVYGSSIEVSFGKFVVLFVLIAFTAMGILTGYLWSQKHY